MRLWTANEWHYYVIETHWEPWSRALRRRSSALTGRVQAWRQAWARRHGPPQEEDLMPDDAVETPTVPLAAKGKLLLASVDEPTAQALRAAIVEEMMALVKDEAVHEARAQLASEYADKHEALLDDLDRQRRQIEQDAAAVADAEAAKQLALDEQDFTDRLDSVRTRLRAWRTRAEVSEALCISLLSQLCGAVDGKPVYLRSGGEGLTALDLSAANTVLARVGLQLKSEQRASARTVATTVEPGKTVSHSLFKITKALAPGVVDEDAEAADGI
jgi:hypothetical protein